MFSPSLGSVQPFHSLVTTKKSPARHWLLGFQENFQHISFFYLKILPSLSKGTAELRLISEQGILSAPAFCLANTQNQRDAKGMTICFEFRCHRLKQTRKNID
jgi:hypothetical protein